MCCYSSSVVFHSTSHTYYSLKGLLIGQCGKHFQPQGHIYGIEAFFWYSCLLFSLAEKTYHHKSWSSKSHFRNRTSDEVKKKCCKVPLCPWRNETSTPIRHWDSATSYLSPASLWSTVTFCGLSNNLFTDWIYGFFYMDISILWAAAVLLEEGSTWNILYGHDCQQISLYCGVWEPVEMFQNCCFSSSHYDLYYL